jgi:hypothetical protein
MKVKELLDLLESVDPDEVCALFELPDQKRPASPGL